MSKFSKNKKGKESFLLGTVMKTDSVGRQTCDCFSKASTEDNITRTDEETKTLLKITHETNLDSYFLWLILQ